MSNAASQSAALTPEQIAALNYIAARHGRSWRRHAATAVRTRSVDLYISDRDMGDALFAAVKTLGAKGLAKWEPTFTAQEQERWMHGPCPTIVHAYRCGL